MDPRSDAKGLQGRALDESHGLYSQDCGHANPRGGGPPKWQKVKAKTTDWDDPTEKDDFIKLSSANHSLSPLEAWAERFVDESMIPKFIARDWDVSHAKSLHEDGYKFAGPVSQVTPNHACVTCMS